MSAPMKARKVWGAVVVFGAILGLFVASLVISDHRDRERSREICGLIVLFDDAYQRQAPTSDLGRQIAAEMHRYRLRLGC